MSLQSGDDTKRDRAIPAQHDRDQLTLDRRCDRVSHLARDLDHARLALSLAVGTVRGEANDREVSEVLQVQASRSERAEQARLAERRGRFFLTGAMRAGAGRDADQAKPHRPFFCLRLRKR